MDDVAQGYLLRLPASDRAPLAGLSGVGQLQKMREWTAARSLETQEYLLRLHKFHNSIALFNRLPNELLMEIFLRVQEECEKGSIKWLWITHVCSYWRGVALGSAKFWTTINVSKNVAYVKHCFRYSDRALVDVGAIARVVEVAAIMAVVSQHSDRVRSFRWLAPRFSDSKSLLASLTFPMDNLEVLEVQRDTDPFSSSTRASLPDYAFPRLHSLTLGRVSLAWTSSIYTGLRCLRLLGPLSRPRPSMDTFLKILKACPMLEDFAIAWCGPFAPRDHRIQIPNEKVALSNLRTLALTHRIMHVSTLLSIISVPATATVDVSCRLEPNRHGSLASLSLVLLPNSETLTVLPHIRSVSLTVNYEVFEMKAYCDTAAIAAMRSPSLTVGIHNVHKFPMSDYFPNALVEVGVVFASSPVLDLHVVGDMDLAVDWRSTLNDLPLLESLAVRSCRASDEPRMLFALIEVLRSPPGGDRAAEAVCPCLEALTISAIDLRQDTVDRLLDMLTFRATVSKVSSIRRLCLQPYAVSASSESLEKLRLAVGEFTNATIPTTSAPVQEVLDDLEGWL